jgi:hypothetical protein
MAALFGKKDDAPGETDAGGDVALMEAELERLAALSLSDLAAEVMTKAFGPDGPGGPGKPGTIEDPTSSERVRMNEIARAVTPLYAGSGVGSEQQVRLTNLVAEGLQILENAALVRVSWRGGTENYFATRRGRAALERSELSGALAAHS